VQDRVYYIVQASMLFKAKKDLFIIIIPSVLVRFKDPARCVQRQ